jgi:hypothetical protein
MNAIELINSIQDFINAEYFVTINNEMIFANNGLTEYNNLIRDQVQDLTGVYIWENADNNEVLYIGMAGKINQQGELVNHSVRKRLIASRGRDEITRRDIQTNQYIRNLMIAENCNQLNIHVIHLVDNQIPGFIEAVLINNFYQQNGILPKYNSAF